MKNKPNFLTYLAGLIDNAKTLRYVDKYGASIRVVVQPVAKLDKVNSDPVNAKKLKECGVQNAIVIGGDEHGVPILLDCGTLKTFLLDPESVGQDYLRHEIKLVHD